MNTAAGAPTPPNTRNGLLGGGLVILSALAFSMSGVLTKVIESDGWTILCWRGLVGGLLVALYVELRRGAHSRGSAFGLGKEGWLLATVGSLASITFIYAFKLTYVANVAVIYATAPFFAALLAWALMREEVSSRTMVAAMGSAIGVGIIVWGGFGGVSLSGDLMAVLMTVLNVLYIVLIRKFTAAPVVWAAGATSFQLVFIGLLFSNPLAAPSDDFFLMMCFGAVFALAVILWTEGTRLIAASQSALFGTTEIPFATLLAFVFLSDVPILAGFIGGGIVIAVVLTHALLDLRELKNHCALNDCAERQQSPAELPFWAV
ncbi:DMT family transporter [Roseobacter weihaiensis]|uniref:DMT family transporter n=1 Tax=Roseobacter weihaiensis TaxID=2763262 RepID=UPI001D0A24C6|nr:DMT family transporter [Roseobacter sp. H9]